MHNLFFTLLQTEPAAASQQASSATGMGGGISMWVMLILIFAVMWLFMIRPQRKQQKEAEKFRNGLQKGDKVVTAGGIYGTIAEVQETTVLLKIDGDVKIKVDKNSLSKDPSVPVAKTGKE